MNTYEGKGPSKSATELYMVYSGVAGLAHGLNSDVTQGITKDDKDL
jgi:hypothetical protein